MRRLTALLLAALLLPATANANPQVALQTDRLEWSGSASGPLVALAALGGTDTPSLVLTAAHLDMTWDESTAYARVPGASYVALMPTSQSAAADAATMRLSAARANWVAYALPVGETTATADCGSAVVSDQSERTVPIMVDRQHVAPKADTSAAVEVVGSDGCPLPTMSVHGDFLLVLWELDGTLTTAQGTTTIQSGQYDTTSARQYFIHASGADLTMQGTTDSPALLYAASLDVHAVDLTLRNVRGSVAGLDVAAPAAVLSGPQMTAHVERGPAGLALSVERAEHLQIDGTSIVLGAHHPSLWPWWALMVLGGAAAAVILRRRSLDPTLLHRRLRRAVVQGREGVAIGLADRLLRRNPRDGTALEARAGAWLRLQSPERALADAAPAAERPDLSSELRAAFAILACRAACQLGKMETALSFLGKAYAEHPATARKAGALYPEVANLATAPGYA